MFFMRRKTKQSSLAAILRITSTIFVMPSGIPLEFLSEYYHLFRQLDYMRYLPFIRILNIAIGGAIAVPVVYLLKALSDARLTFRK